MKLKLRFLIVTIILLSFTIPIQLKAQIYNSPILRTRGSIENCYKTFTTTHKGRVAFLGGSITKMKGWRNLVMTNLMKRFPTTKFDFINAGIPSIGSVPDAFRFENDVLSNGNIDLLFVEAAVNDNTNESSLSAPTKGMEGIIRHAIIANRYTDIIMLDFAYEPFTNILKRGIEPDVILAHERIANYYEIPSIRLDLDIFRRLQQNEFTWEQFGGTHPKPLGQVYYVSAIDRLFSKMWLQNETDKNKYKTPRKAHKLPKLLINNNSYYAGKFLDIHDLKLSKGWEVVENWIAIKKVMSDTKIEKSIETTSDYIRVEAREGFSNVPMLECKTPNKILNFKFKGNAIGVFCVAGPFSGIINYRIDKEKWETIDIFTSWSRRLYIPWLYILADGLKNEEHHIELSLSESHNKYSKGTEIQIRQFVVNQPDLQNDRQ